MSHKLRPKPDVIENMLKNLRKFVVIEISKNNRRKLVKNKQYRNPMAYNIYLKISRTLNNRIFFSDFKNDTVFVTAQAGETNEGKYGAPARASCKTGKTFCLFLRAVEM